MPSTAGGVNGEVFVRINGAALASLLRGPNGMVVQDLLARGERVRVRARQLCPVSPVVPGERRKLPHGNLRDHIVKRVVKLPSGDQGVIVGSDTNYTLYVHEGTRPHQIRPRTKPNLVFFSQRAGRVIVTKLVNHPGTRPNRFLINALPSGRG